MHTVERLMSKRVRTARVNDVVGPLRDTMLRERVHAIPVLDDDNNVAGIITSLDLVEEWSPMMGVQTVMTRDVQMIGPKAPVAEAAAVMVDHGIHHLVVVDRGAVVGVLSSFDVLKYLATELQGVE